MLRNFQLAAIVKQSETPRLLFIPLHQNLQETLAKSFQEQLDTFVENSQEIDFNAGYQPEDDERFCLRDYELPEWVGGETSQTIPELDSITENEETMDSIKGIVAFARNNVGVEIVLFQNFNRSHVIRPGRFLFLQNNTYKTTARPGLTLDNKLSAVYFPHQSKLLFYNFRTVNTFLPLADFYKEASEDEIRAVLGHKLLNPEDTDALASGANQWFRKRFAMLKDSGVLDQYTARQIQSRSKKYDVKIAISNGKIVFPADRVGAKRLLQFLNEELFRGAITETLYETNSKRESD